MKTELTDGELETYARQIALKDIDYAGQLRIRNARVCVVGMGGLGSLLAPKLVGMGVGYLRMVDRDIVARSDLHRQVLYDVDSLGLPKVEVAARKLGRLNPDVELDPIPETLSSINADDLVSGMDVVLDGLDRPEPRYRVNRTCNRFGVPYVFGAAIEVAGNLTTIVPGRSICLECFMPGLKDEDMPKCAVVGVHPSALGVVTALQLSEAVHLLVGRSPSLCNRLLHIDLTDLQFNFIDMERVEECPVCGTRPDGAPAPLEDRFFEETCARDGRRSFILTPRKRIRVNLERLPALMAGRGFRPRATGSMGIALEGPEGMVVSILCSGTMIAQAPPAVTADLRTRVLEIYRSVLIDGLGFDAEVLPVL